MDKGQLDRIEQNQQRIIALLETMLPCGGQDLAVKNEIAMVHAQGLDPFEYLKSRAQKSQKGAPLL